MNRLHILRYIQIHEGFGRSKFNLPRDQFMVGGSWCTSTSHAEFVMICCRMSRSTCLKHAKTRCSLSERENSEKLFFYQIYWRCTPRRTNEICLICFDGHGPQKKRRGNLWPIHFVCPKNSPIKTPTSCFFPLLNPNDFRLHPEPPNPSAPAPPAAPRPQRGRGGARSQPHPLGQRLHQPCPGDTLAQHPVPRDGSSTTSPGPEWTAPHHLNPEMLPIHKNLDSQWVAGKRRWIRSAWKRRGGLLIHRVWGFGVGRQLEVQWGGDPHPPHLL